jgi:hypothetical protein
VCQHRKSISFARQPVRQNDDMIFVPRKACHEEGTVQRQLWAPPLRPKPRSCRIGGALLLVIYLGQYSSLLPSHTTGALDVVECGAILTQERFILMYYARKIAISNTQGIFQSNYVPILRNLGVSYRVCTR